MGPMREAIEGAVGEDRVVEEGHPLVHGAIAGDHGGRPAVTLDEHNQNVAICRQKQLCG